MSIIFWTLFVFLLAYVFILALRIMLGWFAPEALGRAWHLLVAATDPYLKFFSRISFLRGRLFDFSPVAAVLVAAVAASLAERLASYLRITLGFVLASLFSAAWSGAAFLLLFFLFVGVLRTIPLVVRGVSSFPLWRAADLIVQPVVEWVARVFHLGRKVGYTQHLLLTLGLILVSLLLGHYLLWGYGPFVGIVGVFESLPI